VALQFPILMTYLPTLQRWRLGANRLRIAARSRPRSARPVRLLLEHLQWSQLKRMFVRASAGPPSSETLGIKVG